MLRRFVVNKLLTFIWTKHPSRPCGRANICCFFFSFSPFRNISSVFSAKSKHVGVFNRNIFLTNLTATFFLGKQPSPSQTARRLPSESTQAHDWWVHDQQFRKQLKKQRRRERAIFSTFCDQQLLLNHNVLLIIVIIIFIEKHCCCNTLSHWATHCSGSGAGSQAFAVVAVLIWVTHDCRRKQSAFNSSLTRARVRWLRLTAGNLISPSCVIWTGNECCDKVTIMLTKMVFIYLIALFCCGCWSLLNQAIKHKVFWFTDCLNYDFLNNFPNTKEIFRKVKILWRQSLVDYLNESFIEREAFLVLNYSLP